MNSQKCEVCKSKIDEPIYWADPRFYNIAKKIFFCSAQCSYKYYLKIKDLLKN